MKYAPLILALVMAAPCHAEVLEQAWDKYHQMAVGSAAEEKPAANPGIIIGEPQGKGESAFDYQWKYRDSVWEMHGDNPAELARAIYSLALHAGDISLDLPIEKFYGAALGFHYSGQQISAWLNDALKSGRALSPRESGFAGRLLLDGALRVGPDGFEPGEKIKHVLGAAPGKKRGFAENLRHERWHVLWDESEAFRAGKRAEWAALSPAEKAAARAELKNYDQSNEEQLIEEWAVKRAEKAALPLK